MESIYPDYVSYPAISFIMAGQKILEDLGTEALDEFHFYKENDLYSIYYNDMELHCDNIIDVMIKTWIRHKKN